MPTLSDPTLVCVQQAGSEEEVVLAVSYLATFSPIERHLAAHGLVFEERITVIGEDFGASADVVLHTLPPEPIEVPAGTTPLRVARRRTLAVRWTSLREDPAPLNGEIDARIDIVAVGLPTGIVSATTPELSLANGAI